jgi:hypothetical protein
MVTDFEHYDTPDDVVSCLTNLTGGDATNQRGWRVTGWLSGSKLEEIGEEDLTYPVGFWRAVSIARPLLSGNGGPQASH